MTKDRHSLRRNVPVFAGASMSYNGNAAGYRHILFERFVLISTSTRRETYEQSPERHGVLRGDDLAWGSLLR